MKKVYRFFVSLVFICALWFQTVSACSLYIPPLRKDFRAAKTVFLGKVLNIENDYIPTEEEKKSMPSHWKSSDGKLQDPYSGNLYSKVTFEIKNKWKGDLSGQQAFAALAFWGCGCPGDWDQFKVGEEYVVFASGKKFITVCNAWRTRLSNKAATIKKLDDFGFRLWARIYPF